MPHKGHFAQLWAFSKGFPHTCCALSQRPFSMPFWAFSKGSLLQGIKNKNQYENQEKSIFFKQKKSISGSICRTKKSIFLTTKFRLKKSIINKSRSISINKHMFILIRIKMGCSGQVPPSETRHQENQRKRNTSNSANSHLL